MYPIPDPIAAETNPTRGPKRILVMNMAIGANVIAETGGGTGMEIAVKTAINAAMTPVNATIFVSEVGPVT
jgi:hypothetical protein